MKAVIVELKNDLAAVLSDDGCITTVKNKNYEIGQIIQMSNQKINITKKIATFAASAAALVILSVGTWAYASPYTYVSIDVNPSIEFTLNRFDRVIQVKAVNDDGDELLQEVSLDNLENKTIEDAITRTVKQISELGYFAENEAGIVIATSSEDDQKAESLAEELQETVEQETEDQGDEVEVEVFSVRLERVDDARELGVTPGKLNLVEKLQAAATDPTAVNIEEWLSKPVKDIMKATKEYKKSTIDTEEASNEEQNEDEKALEQAEKDAENALEEAQKAERIAKEAKEKADKKDKEAKNKAKEAKDETDAEEKKAAEEAAQLAEKEAKVAKDAADKAKEDAEKASEKAKEKADKAKEKADKAKDNAIDKANEVTDDISGKKTRDENDKNDNQSRDNSASDMEDSDYAKDDQDKKNDKSMDDDVDENEKDSDNPGNSSNSNKDQDSDDDQNNNATNQNEGNSNNNGSASEGNGKNHR